MATVHMKSKTKVPSSTGKLIHIETLWNLQSRFRQGEHLAFYEAMHRNSKRITSLMEMKNIPADLMAELQMRRNYDKSFRDFLESKLRRRR